MNLPPTISERSGTVLTPGSLMARFKDWSPRAPLDLEMIKVCRSGQTSWAAPDSESGRPAEDESRLDFKERVRYGLVLVCQRQSSILSRRISSTGS
jgi:hypothetical protein